MSLQIYPNTSYSPYNIITAAYSLFSYIFIALFYHKQVVTFKGFRLLKTILLPKK